MLTLQNVIVGQTALRLNVETEDVRVRPEGVQHSIPLPVGSECIVTKTYEWGGVDITACWKDGDIVCKGTSEQVSLVLFDVCERTLDVEVDMTESKRDRDRRLISERLSQERAHYALTRVVTLANRRDLDDHRLPIYLVGPAGSGKTFLGRQVAKVVGLPFRSIVFSPGLPESALIGRMVPSLTTGEQVYHGTPFVEAFMNGGVFLGDEGDNADPSTMIILNQSLANGAITLPDGREVERHQDFVFIMGANTYGRGADRIYVGRTQLDAATLDRFALSKVYIDYDPDLERDLVGDEALLERWWDIRARVAETNMQRVVSTRGLIQAWAAFKDGESIDEIVDVFTQDWTAGERQKVGLNPEVGAHLKAGPGWKAKKSKGFERGQG